MTDGQAVRPRLIVGMIGRNEAARPYHVFDDNRGTPRNVLHHMARNRPPIHVEAAARGKAHYDANGLTAERDLLTPRGG